MVYGSHFMLSLCTEKHEPMLSAALNYFSQEQEKIPLSVLH